MNFGESPSKDDDEVSADKDIDNSNVTEPAQAVEADIDEDELVEKLLREAEENLSHRESSEQTTSRPRYSPLSCPVLKLRLHPGPLPKLYFESTKRGNQLLTDHIEDSVVISAQDLNVKRLVPPKSRIQHKKVVSPIPGDR